MAKSKSSEIKNTSDMRQMLLDTIGGVRDGSVDLNQARAVAALSKTILQSAKLDLDYLRYYQSDAAIGSESRVLNLVAQ